MVFSVWISHPSWFISYGLRIFVVFGPLDLEGGVFLGTESLLDLTSTLFTKLQSLFSFLFSFQEMLCQLYVLGTEERGKEA